MKALLTLALVLSTPFVSAQVIEDEEDNTTKTCHVSGGSSDKALLMRVFGAVRKMEDLEECEECFKGTLSIDYVVEW